MKKGLISSVLLQQLLKKVTLDGNGSDVDTDIDFYGIYFGITKTSTILKDVEFELYNLEKDISEQVNLINEPYSRK